MRKKRNYKRVHASDVKYGSVSLGRFVNYIMREGKKQTAQGVVYDTFDIIKEKMNQDPILVFNKAIENASPMLEVSTRRVGGANYQVPREVRSSRKFQLALRWIIDAARAKKGKRMAEKLAEEIMIAARNEGPAIKKKQDLHRMAEANRAFAHFGRPR